MKALTVDTYGKGWPLTLVDVTEPHVGDHDVLVRIVAAGVDDSGRARGKGVTILTDTLGGTA